MKQGGAKFISFEGGEGAGKTTQIELLGKHLRALGHDVVITREPGGTPDAEAVRDLVLDGEPGRWSACEEMLLMYTARSQLVRTIIRPALERGTWVLSDRFADSTFVYQGYAGGVSVAQIRALHQLVLGDFNPDITFIMNIEPTSGMARVHSRAEALNQFELRDDVFYQRIRTAYLNIAKADPARCAVVNGAQKPDAIAAQIWAIVETRAGISP